VTVGVPLIVHVAEIARPVGSVGDDVQPVIVPPPLVAVFEVIAVPFVNVYGLPV
jgi:hypothetical protein